MIGTVKTISYSDAIDFLLPRHYSGRKPNIMYAFGWFISGELVAVCTFGKPASNCLCKGICGEENSKYVIELNRLCRVDSLKYPLSSFVSVCLKRVAPSIVVSYSDMAMTHHGYIYQACNFLYIGCTKQRTDKYVSGGKHPRHYSNSDQGEYRLVRSVKHRYVYFSAPRGLKKLKKEWMGKLSYKILPYPKGDNKNYKLGEFLKPVLVKG